MHLVRPSIGRLWWLLLGNLLLWAQERQVSPPPSPLAPAQQKYPPEILATVGIGWGIQQGAFRGSCSEDFTAGNASSWLVGLSASAPLTATVLWGGSLMVQQSRLRSSYRERELVTLSSSTDTAVVPLQMHNRAELTTTEAVLWAYLRWRPTPWLVLSTGPTLRIPLSLSFQHTKEPAQDEVTLPTGVVASLERQTTVVESGTLPTRLGWGALSHLGVDIVLTSQWWTSLGLYFCSPLSSTLKSPATLRLLQWYATLSLGKTW